jgi:DNA ligase-associated metallophosphoesterase
MTENAAGPYPGSATVIIAGERFDLLPHLAACWVSRRTLLVADLHLGKGESLRAVGAPLSLAAAEGVHREKFARLRDAIATARAERVVILGDVVHAGVGLTAALVDAAARELDALRADLGVRFQAVRGNHDRRFGDVASRWGIEDLGSEHIDAGFVLRHDPAEDSRGYVWCGHVHPTVVLRHGADAMKLDCFLLGPRCGILPAFTRFSTGASIRPGPQDRVYAVVGDQVVPIPQ